MKAVRPASREFWRFCRLGVAGGCGLGLFACSAIDGPLTPQESLRYLQTEPGLRVELVAAEPLVVDPVAVTWDERGRMFVVEDRGYPLGPGPGAKPEGQVVLLEDSDGDGVLDRRTVYADGLSFPNGIMPWKGGVYVTCAPNLYYFKDTNADGVADVKEVVFTGFQDLSTTQLRVSHPILGIDNWIYLTSGLTSAKVTVPGHPEIAPVLLNRMDGRFRPGGMALEAVSGTAQFGQTFDAYGRRFICSNRNHLQQVVMEQDYLRRNPRLRFSQSVEDIPDHGAACKLFPLSANIVTAASHGGYVTSACGVTIYNGSAMPANYRGNSFTCEPAGNLVHRDILSPNGITDTARRAFPTNEFLASPDNWFRPVNLAVGPDGALYVCDMYRKTIEHPEYLPEAMRATTDFKSGKELGRIYRLVADGSPARPRPRPAPTDLGASSTAKLCAELQNSNAWSRLTAQRLLLERRDPRAIPGLSRLARHGRTAEARIEALELLAELGGLKEAVLLSACSDAVGAVREHAFRLAEPRLRRSAALSDALLSHATDSDPRARFQCALSLGAGEDARKVPALARIAAGDLNDKWMRAAVLSAIANHEVDFFNALLPLVPQPPPEGLVALMEELGGMLAAVSGPAQRDDELHRILASDRPADLAWQLAAVSAFGKASFTTGELLTRRQALTTRASNLAKSTEQPVRARLAAINLLGEETTAAPLLETLLEPQEPPEIQTAAARALKLIGPVNLGEALASGRRWNAYTPAVRDTVMTMLMADPQLLHALFAELESGRVPAWTVNPDRRAQLMRHSDPLLKARAEKLFRDLTSGDRMKAYESAKAVLKLNGDARHGHLVFQKNCVACHTFSGEGHAVGPDLTGIRNQPAEVLLLHIVVPEFEIMPIYTAYNVETRQGESYSGLLAAESAQAITLRMAQGIEQVIPRRNVATMTTSRLSLMPQELEQAMSSQELADLLAFLKGK